MMTTWKCFYAVGVTVLTSVIVSVHSGTGESNTYQSIRVKRGAAYAGGHPGNGNEHYGQGGVGIPGLNSAIEYKAYNALLNQGQHQSGYGQSRHGRKLTVDEAIGRYGHHTLTKSYPYTQDPSTSRGYSGGSSSGYSPPAPSYHGGGGGRGRGSSSGGGSYGH